MMVPFSGSYEPGDVAFLLKPVQLAPTNLAEKERLIQSGRRHYSEMISHESLPSAAYLDVFRADFARQKSRLARHLLILAGLIVNERPGHDPVVIVSLARAGTPIGVLLARIVRQHFGRQAVHYSVSIIRDRGLDGMALQYILSRHRAEAVVFVDGWTGKGVIARELQQSVTAWNEQHRVNLDAGLFTVADLSGTASRAATSEDYLIPSCVLGCTISGLISRSILNNEVIGPGDFHGCIFYREYQESDLSQFFVDELTKEVNQLGPHARNETFSGVRPEDQALLRQRSGAFVRDMQTRYTIRDVNFIKPGVGEATRVLLRRVPDRLLLREPDAVDVAHLQVLASEKGVPVQHVPDLPYQAAALIQEVGA